LINSKSAFARLIFFRAFFIERVMQFVSLFEKFFRLSGLKQVVVEVFCAELITHGLFSNDYRDA
jgi:hypothetical protein